MLNAETCLLCHPTNALKTTVYKNEQEDCAQWKITARKYSVTSCNGLLSYNTTQWCDRIPT